MSEPGAFRATGRDRRVADTQHTDTLVTILDRLAAGRRFVNADVLACMDVAPGDSPRVGASERRLHDRRESARRQHSRYVADLAQLRGYSRDELQAAVEDTTARLERGWEMEGDAVDELFERLTLHLEVLSDALAGPQQAHAHHAERLARLG